MAIISLAVIAEGIKLAFFLPDRMSLGVVPSTSTTSVTAATAPVIMLHATRGSEGTISLRSSPPTPAFLTEPENKWSSSDHRKFAHWSVV